MALSPLARVISLVCGGIISAAAGITFYLLFPSLLKSEIERRLILSEGTMVEDYWRNMPIPIYSRFYLFHVTNPMDVYRNLSKPILEERGPYTFSERRVKVNVTWHSNGTVSYRQIKMWFFRPELTNGSLDDLITTVNAPMLAVAGIAKKHNSMFFNMAVSLAFEVMNSSWFVTKPVRQLLFEGYNDPILDEANKYLTVEFDKFGWMYMRNNTDDGIYTIHTGKMGLDNIDEVDHYKGSHSFDFLDSPCKKVRGSAGDMWPPYVESDKLQLFFGEACRTLELNYYGEGTLQGLETKRFYANHLTLDNGQHNPSNKCYCVDGQCLPTGGHDVSACQNGAPVVLSYPHFLYADSSYSRGIDGLMPDPKKHLFYLDVDKIIGLPVRASAKIQLNLIFEGNPSIPQFENVTGRTYFPAMWVSEEGAMTDELIGVLKLAVHTVPLIMHVVCFFLIGFGATLILAALILSYLYASAKVQPEYKAVSSVCNEKAMACKDFSYVNCGTHDDGQKEQLNGRLL